MSQPLINAKDRLLNENTGGMPDVSGAVQNYFQPMTFLLLNKTVVNSQNSEQVTAIDFRGSWQPLSDRALQIKPEGQRSWKWFQIHSDRGLNLNTDDVITYLGTNYRVMAQRDYSLEGFWQYHVINDFKGSGP